MTKGWGVNRLLSQPARRTEQLHAIFLSRVGALSIAQETVVTAAGDFLARFFDLRCSTTPFDTVISPAGTRQRSAAAPTSIARAVAPALRSCSYEFASAVLPPVSWTSPMKRLL